LLSGDTSPLTALIQVNRLGLLQELYGKVLIPEAVCRELIRSHPRLPAFLETRSVRDRAAVSHLGSELDLGEAEAIVLAKEVGASLLLMDEKLGRLAAAREGLAITGLMGVLIAAKRRGMVVSIRELVGEIEVEAGFRVSEAVKREVFRAAGE
jgi:predicted nucleic acid-binding protein